VSCQSFENPLVIEQHHLFAFCFCEKAVFLGFFVLAFIANEGTENFLVSLVNIHRLAFIAFRIKFGVKEHRRF